MRLRPAQITLPMSMLALLLAACAGPSTVQRPVQAPAVAVQPAGAAGASTAGRAPADADGYQPPRQVALLLPLTGPLAKAAEPVRDGYMSGYYAQQRRRPVVRFYDTNALGTLAAYDRAVSDGADYVVGPLAREAVAELFAHVTPKVPVLALNSNGTVPAGSASFALTPEDEAISVADRLRADGANNALVITGGDSTQRRAATAFAARLNAAGGRASAPLVLGSATLAQDLASALVAMGGQADAVFLAVRGEQVAQANTALAATPAANARRWGTSQLAQGKAEGASLDGIVFPTEAWNVRSTALAPRAAALADLTPSARGPAARLFAFGHDAWLITAFPGLLGNRRSGLAGATGDLQLDAGGRIVRAPAWSVLRQGELVPFDNR